MILRVDPKRRHVILSLPPRISLTKALQFAEEHRPWILERWRLLEECIAFAPSQSIPLRGKMMELRHDPLVREIKNNGDVLILGGDPQHFPRRLRDYLKTEAKKDILPLCIDKAHRLALPLPAIYVREMRSRWGSCGKSLNFNWRLILAPPFVLEYVVAHEIAHLKHRHHQPSFWELCYQLSENGKAARAWLRQSGSNLYRYGG